MPLTDIIAKNAKPKEKLYKLTDAEGMFLSVRPNGGKEKILSFGVYPEVSLKEARDKRDSAVKC